MSEGPSQSYSHRRAIAKAFGMVVLDIMLFGAPVISTLFAFGLPIYLLLSLNRYQKKKDYSELKFRLKNLVIYGMAAGLVFWLSAVDNERIRSHSENVIAAVKAYHTKYDRYPDALERLVPEFIDSVPQDITYSSPPDYPDETYIVDWSKAGLFSFSLFYEPKRFRFSTGRWDRYD